MLFLYLGLGLAFVGLAYSQQDTIESVAQDISVAVGAPLDSWTRFDALFQKYGSENDVPWQWLKAICLNESSLGQAPSVARGLADPTDVEGSTSSDGKSWGIMQMTIPTARDFDPAATPTLLNDPEYSVGLAAQFVAHLMGYFNDTDPRYLEWVVKSYNEGPGNVKKEIAELIAGNSGDYWARFQRNLTRVEG